MTDQIASLYADHIRTVRERWDRALAETGFDHAVVAAGSLREAFLDDHTYPFIVNPQFKAWVPVVDNPNCWIVYTPGQKPLLVYWQPVDYWYKPAETPSGRSRAGCTRSRIRSCTRVRSEGNRAAPSDSLHPLPFRLPRQ